MKSKFSSRVSPLTQEEVMQAFLKSDIQLGLAFLRFMLHTGDSALKKRTIRQARKAYEVALNMIRELNAADAQVLTKDLERLKSALEDLGESSCPEIPQECANDNGKRSCAKETTDRVQQLETAVAKRLRSTRQAPRLPLAG